MHTSEQTHSGVLPQPRTLETAPADTAGVATKRGAVDGVSLTTGVQHGRGESTPSGVPSPDTSTSVVVSERGRKAPQPKVPVLDKHHQPLDPCHPARARKLLRSGRAVVHRASPLVIRLKDRTASESVTHPHVVKVDPGSRTTGLTVARETETVDTATGEVSTVHEGVWLGELVHRGLAIKNKLHARAQLRRGRRSRNLRYRAPRFNNRTRKAIPGMGVWLAPSIAHRVVTTGNWVDRLARWYPITGVWVEDVRFDTHLMVNPEVSGVTYQQGTLAGFEVREYLLEKFGRACVYCDATNTPLNIDHVHPKSRGGSDRVSNLTLACIDCNQTKGNRPVEEFVTDPARLARIKARLQAPLRDAAAVNTTRRALTHLLAHRGHPVITGTGGRTKYNRTRLGIPKTHCLDALAVGPVDTITTWPDRVTTITCTGRGSYSRTRTDKYGFPRLALTRTKRHHGFATGDLVRAMVPTGKNAGVHTGRVAVRATGSFNITTTHGTVQGINHRHVQLTQRADGYTYRHTNTLKGVER